MEEKKKTGTKKNTQSAKDAKPKKTAESANGANKSTGGGSRLRTLEMRYQPIFDIHLNMAIDFEASLRINDRKLGVLLQDAFLPVAEKSNLVCELNKWSVEEGCEAILRCEKREADINRIVLPMSVKYLTKNYFMSQVTKIVEKYEVNPDKFCFNISESILEAEKDQVVKNIKAARDYGFLVSIDDFGVEYTSITHFGHYDVDYIGLHRSVIDDIMTEERVQNMVQGIIDFARKLNTQIKVDGVDTEEKAKLLRSMGVDQMMGELYGKPISEKQIKI